MYFRKSQKYFSGNFKTFSLFTKYLFPNFYSETGLFEPNYVKMYINRGMIKTERRGREGSRSEGEGAERKTPKIIYSNLLYKLSYKTDFWHIGKL